MFEELNKRRQAVADNIAKSFENNIEKALGAGYDPEGGDGDNVEKARHGFYGDTAENRKMNRVGQEYGSKKKEETLSGKKQSSEKTDGGGSNKLSQSAAKASDKALERASKDPKAPEDVKVAAKKELANRGSEEEKPTMSVKEQLFKDYKKLSADDMFKRGFDVGEADENYLREDEKTGEIVIVSFQNDGKVLFNKVSEEGGEDLKEYGSKEEFMEEFVTPEMRQQYSDEKRFEAEIKKRKEAREAKRKAVRYLKTEGGSKEMDDFLQKNSEHFKSVLDQYGARDFFDLQDKVEKKYADDDDDPYGYEHMEKLYFKCLHAVPDEKFIGMEGKL